MILKKNVFLKDFTNYKIGGPASYFLEVKNKNDLIEGIKEWQNIKEGKDIFILGGGTNLLISDNGFDGLVIHNLIKFINQKDNLVTVGSGALIKDLLDFCVEKSLSGFEWAGGLPGTIGGAVRGNAGAFKGETKDCVIKVKGINTDSLKEFSFSNKDCEFKYRDSIFKSGFRKKEFITEVKIKLKKGNQLQIRQEISQKVEYRKNRHPLEYPNAGSIFKNIPFSILSQELKKKLKPMIKNDPIPVIPVVKLLLECNLWERRVGGAKFSDKHPNFIVNTDNAKAKDVKELIEIAKRTVKDKFGITLEEEIMYVGF